MYDVTTWIKTITIHILPNISRNKSNQTMVVGQLTEYNIRNIFVEKSHTKYGGESMPRFSSKNSKLDISLEQ